MNTVKHWKYSKTIQFFALVLLAGGLNLLNDFVTKGTYTWQDFALLGIAFVGITLRVMTNRPLKK
jgi:hypothetical protein